MKFVVQRVAHASVTVDDTVCGKINKGFMVLIGVGKDDDETIADKMVSKLIHMRIFEDENGKTNLALKDVGGELLLISQFTLYANCKKGNRPSFTDAGSPDKANALYEYIISKCKEEIEIVEKSSTFEQAHYLLDIGIIFFPGDSSDAAAFAFSDMEIQTRTVFPVENGI